MSSKGKIIGAIVLTIIIGLGVSYGIYNMDNPKEIVKDNEDEWNRSGLFGINKDTYRLGDLVFFAGNLSPDQIVIINVLSPEGKTIQKRTFNGADRELIKFYFKPDTSVQNGIYRVDQLVGEWTIQFNGVIADDLKFTIVDEYVPGSESDVADIPGYDNDEDVETPDENIVGDDEILLITNTTVVNTEE